MGTLCDAVSKKIRLEGLELFQTHRSNPTPLEQLLFYIYFLPFGYRKAILDACRIQESILHNYHLQLIFDKLQPRLVTFSSRGIAYSVSPLELANLFENIYDSSLSCSLLSYFCRAESSPHLDEARQIKEECLAKEISAALYYKSSEQALDYCKLYGKVDNSFTVGPWPSVDNRTSFLFTSGIRKLKSSWSRDSPEIFLPYFNGRKNLGYTTQEMFYEQISGDKCTSPVNKDVTSLDLLRWYFRTGKQILGPIEPRMKWGYGDIKPRLYYCLGGKDYWIGCFAQPIANELCKILPSTNPFSRFTVSRIGSISSEQIVVTYDYTSFTTSLDELKFFLYHLSQEFRGVSVDVLDVHSGIEVIDVGEYLMMYNEMVNVNQEFDLRRLMNQGDEGWIFRQGRSGSLGTQGNIVFSTVLHGLHLGSFTQTPDGDSCVGDDALTKILASLLSAFIDHVNKLGHIHPDKFTTLQKPPPDDPTLANRQQFKYLKRPITVDFTGSVITGSLDAFPGLADVLFPEGDGVHSSSRHRDSAALIRSFCTQWGTFLTRHENSVGLSYTPEHELSIILGAVRLVYDRVGLPHTGCLPGTRFHVFEGRKKFERVTDFFAPPCDDLFVFEKNWVMDLYSRLGGQYFPQPVRVGGEIPLDLHARAGSRVRATTTGLVRLLEGLEIIVTELVIEQVRFDEKYASHLRGYITGVEDMGNFLNEVLFLVDPPVWYFEVLLRSLPDYDYSDPLEKLDEISTIFSKE